MGGGGKADQNQEEVAGAAGRQNQGQRDGGRELGDRSLGSLADEGELPRHRGKGADHCRGDRQVGDGLGRRLVVSAHGVRARSEEHTSELQSLMRISYAVFCLKKKMAATTIIRHSKGTSEDHYNSLLFNEE